MKIFGYVKSNEEDLQELDEVTFQASSRELTDIANFLLKYAEVMRNEGSSFEHAHMVDEYEALKNTKPDIIVYNGEELSNEASEK